MSECQNARLFVGNYDDGIQLRILNIDDAFVGHTTGKLARKCEEVAPRATHMLGPDEAALLYAPLPEGFASYYASLYGHEPCVFYPKQQFRDPNQPLSLLISVLQDETLLHVLREQGIKHQWSLSPFIGHPLVFELARRTGLTVTGMDEKLVCSGRVVELNNKAEFQIACQRIGIPIPPSIPVEGWKEMCKTATRVFDREGQVFLRRSRAAGGLGNCKVTSKKLKKVGRESVQEYLEHTLKPRHEWESEVVLVEPVLEIVSSPTALAHVRGMRFEIVGIIDQILDADGEAFIGGDFPSKESLRIQDLLTVWMDNYLQEHFIPRGGQGWVDIDFGILRDGSIVAFESNARVTGNNHGLAVRKRLLNGVTDRMYTWTNDALKVPSGTTLQHVLNSLGSTHVWDATRKDGVIISIPPAGDEDHFSMGYVGLASTSQRKSELNQAMQTFALK